jgi:hypothetical protein
MMVELGFDKALRIASLALMKNSTLLEKGIAIVIQDHGNVTVAEH